MSSSSSAPSEPEPKVVERVVEKIVEVPVEKIVVKEVPVEKIVEKIVEKEVAAAGVTDSSLSTAVLKAFGSSIHNS